MSANTLLVWNARGLNSRVRRSVVRSIAFEHRASIICIQETKIALYNSSMNTDVVGSDYDFAYLPTDGASGGAVTCWRRDLWTASDRSIGSFSVTVKLTPAGGTGEPWWLTNVYGPPNREDKPAFLQELCSLRAPCAGPWLLCGDFNMILRDSDKNNSRIDRATMQRFRRAIDSLHLVELFLHGRLYTWSSRRDEPTLERIDRCFGSVEWVSIFPSHHLRCLSSDSSDHAPLLLILATEPWAPPHFRFEPFWAKRPDFAEVVQIAWGTPLLDTNPCRAIDQKLRTTTHALKSWCACSIGDFRLQLAAARVAVYELDTMQETRPLTAEERAWHCELKANTLGLASLVRTTARLQARSRYLREG